jgi:hypothetical protein
MGEAGRCCSRPIWLAFKCLSGATVHILSLPASFPTTQLASQPGLELPIPYAEHPIDLSPPSSHLCSYLVSHFNASLTTSLLFFKSYYRPTRSLLLPFSFQINFLISTPSRHFPHSLGICQRHRFNSFSTTFPTSIDHSRPSTRHCVP